MGKVLQALFYCHQMPERSLYFRGKQLPICARCTGILLGYLAGIFFAFMFGKLPIPATILCFIPLIIDGGGQLIGKWESSNLRRLITGLLAGAGTDFLLYEIYSLGFQHGKQIFYYFISKGAL